jgi:hypothetical protein
MDQRLSKPRPHWDEERDEVVDGDPELDWYRLMLWSHAAKATIARIQVLRLIDSTTNGISVKEMASRPECRGLAASTIYRVASFLSKEELVGKRKSLFFPRASTPASPLGRLLS